ncbi:hypothetical protein DH2020_004146 [Rehmannia glutinosa]|uniref:Serpin domain-containing protein n=1 Tax=Rehmannia glutinosa TaxID=99300 RepID=A0ABR0XNM8_REHGL
MDFQESILSQTDVSLSLAKHVISTKAKDTNFVFSPLSIHVVLGLIAAGSKGPTQDQLLGYLKSKSAEELNSLSSQLVTLLFADGGPLGGPLLSFANGVWIDQSLTLKPAFKEVVENAYKAASNHADFQTKTHFNHRAMHAYHPSMYPWSAEASDSSYRAATIRLQSLEFGLHLINHPCCYSRVSRLPVPIDVVTGFASDSTRRNWSCLCPSSPVAVEVTKEVNTWADKETNGLIKDILPSGSVDATTRLILANAVYFKGAWNEKFDASITKDHDFFLLNGTSVQVPFMTSKKKQYVRAFDDFKVLGLPYKQGEDKRKFSMYFFLPDAKDGLPALVEKIGSKSGFIEHHLPYQQVKVRDFRIPKFKINFGFEASEVLKGQGLVLPFSGDGLTEMVDSTVGKNLYVSSIFHKSFIEVNEEGTEAAAATAGMVMLMALRIEDKVDFVADHPFVFVVREDMTGVVLFIGQVLNPLAD